MNFKKNYVEVTASKLCIIDEALKAKFLEEISDDADDKKGK